MKINYWHYWFEAFTLRADGKKRRVKEPRYKYDLNGLLSQFSAFDNANFKRNFHQKGDPSEFLMLKEISDAFIFLKTKNAEILKLIKTDDLSIEDIEDQLHANGQNMAFASYLSMDRSFIVLGATLNGPTMNAFADFVNELLRRIEANLIFCFQPVGAKIAKTELRGFNLIGNTEIVIPSTGNFFTPFFTDYLGMNPPNTIRSLTIKISPKKDADISDTVEKLADKELTTADKFKIRAKVNAQDVLLDYFLTDQGQKNHIVDKPKNDRTALHEIKKALRDTSLVNDMLTGVQYEKLQDTNMAWLFAANTDSWSGLLCDDEAAHRHT